ncbi:MAG: response regulator [Candidatus Eisenbacteria bacterium]|nr:response regulator [Candidatus Eisenbacteria bacterium]
MLNTLGYTALLLALAGLASAHLRARVQARRREEELRASEQRVRQLEAAGRNIDLHCQLRDAILDSIDDVIWSIAAADWKPIYMNRAVQSVYGWSVEDFEQHPRLRLDLVHPDDRPLVAERWAELDLIGTSAIEYRILRRDGVTRWVQDRCRMAFGEDGRPERIEGITIDITERRNAEAAITRATAAALENARLKAEFLANMSHEVRTPLNGILGMAELALATPLTPEQREFVRTIRASGDALLLTLNNLLDYSALESGRMQLEVAPFRLSEAIESATRAFASVAAQRGVEILVDLDPSIADLRDGDGERFQQILTHLLGNAVKFTESGEILLRIATDADHDDLDWIVLSVLDTGIGIAPEQMGRIFAAFVQVDGSNSRTYGGNGLGLAICAELTHLMSGRIWAESEKGHGSAFHVSIPLPKANSEDAELAQLPELAGKALLLLDDNPAARRLIGKIFVSLGLTVHPADSGEAAVRALKQAQEAGTPFHYVAIDTALGTSDGFAVGRRIRSIPELEGVELIMLTSPALRGEARRCSELGAFAQATKPLLRHDLVRALTAGLRQRAARAAVRNARLNVLNSVPEVGSERELDRAHILLAEDNAVNQKLAVRLLERNGYRVTVVENGQLAVAAHARERFDLILMDLQMPVMDGFEATSNIRKAEAETGRHTPIVALTAHAMKGDRERCLLSGMDEYVTKPIKPSLLYATIDALLVAGPEPGREMAEGADGHGNPTDQVDDQPQADAA